MWWVPLAAAGAQQLTSILSNQILGNGGTGHEGQVNLMQAQSNINKEHKIWAATNLQRMAKLAGVSPLTMLGQGGNLYSGPMQASGPGRKERDTTFDNMGQAVGKAMAELMYSKSEEAELDNKLKKNQVEASSIELELLKKKIDEDRNYGGQPLDGQGDVIHSPVQQTPATQGIAEGVQPYSRVMELGGKATEQPSQDMTDMVSESFLAQAEWYGHRIKQAGNDYVVSWKARRGSESALREMRTRQQLLSKRLPPGYEYRYKPRSGWYRAKIGEEGSRLWLNYKYRASQKNATPFVPHKRSRSSYKWGRVKKQYRAPDEGGGW